MKYEDIIYTWQMDLISISASSPCFDHSSSSSMASWPGSPVGPVACNHTDPEHVLSQVMKTTRRKLWSLCQLRHRHHLYQDQLNLLKVNQKIFRSIKMITEWVVVGLILEHIRKLMRQLNWPFTSVDWPLLDQPTHLSFQENIWYFLFYTSMVFYSITSYRTWSMPRNVREVECIHSIWN